MAILGIDEVGRGPLAGPLVVGAVILPENKDELAWVAELNDSKKLSAGKRERLAEVIVAEAPAVGLGWVSSNELDEVGISEALTLATKRAVKSVQALHARFSQIVIDGKVNFLCLTNLGKYVTTVVKADALIKEVSAASIVAKCARDRYMKELGAEYPGYGFCRNVGYGTAEHLAAIRAQGLTPEHRRSFEPCKSMVGFSRNEVSHKDTTSVGARGEDATVSYLEADGHTVLMRNFRTRVCEIDIVSVKDGRVYFTEVKTRASEVAGGGLFAVDRKKLMRMKFAVEVFIKMYPEFGGFDLQLAVAAVDGGYQVLKWLTLDAFDV